MQDRQRFMSLVGLTLVIFACSIGHAGDEDDGFTPPADLAEGWYARIDTTMGRIVARLLPEQAPQSVAHFAAMAEGWLEWFDGNVGKYKKERYYDGIQVHRASAGMLFEAGDPMGTGYGAPDLYVAPEGEGPIDFAKPFRLGMVKQGGVHSAVMFFVTSAAQPWLSRFHPCFGMVVSGRDTVTRITQVKTFRDGRPIEAPVIERIRIFKVGEPPPLPQPEPYRPQRKRFEAKSEEELRRRR